MISILLLRFFDGNDVFNLTVCCSSFSLSPDPVDSGEEEEVESPPMWRTALGGSLPCPFMHYMYAFRVTAGRREPEWSFACRELPSTFNIRFCYRTGRLWGVELAHTMAVIPPGTHIKAVYRYIHVIKYLLAFTPFAYRRRGRQRQFWEFLVCEMMKGSDSNP